jgi:type I restriction enzyme S subunit
MGNPKLMSNVMGKIKIPVPPIEVQEKIIPILDNFTALTERLTSELKTELAARKKQYEYLRDMIINSARGDVKKTTMGNALTFLNGRAYKQQELLAEGKYPVLRVGNFYTNNSWYYSDLELEEDKYCDNGDLLYSWAATLGPKIWDGGKCIFHYHIWKILFDETKIDKRYLYYYLQYDLAQIASSTTKSTMIHVSMGSMKERPILIPNIDEQRRIADLISRLDVLYNSIKNELHSEIVVRQKQYEYYRSKLLSFQER